MPTNLKTGQVGKRKIKNPGHPSDWTTRGKTFLLDGPSHSTEECKVLKEYFVKYSAQQPHIEREARSGAVNLGGTIEEVNSIKSHDAHISISTRGESGKKS